MPLNNERRSFWISCKDLSVEPAGFLLVLSMVVSTLLFQNIRMETTCRVDLGYDMEVCKEIINKVNITYKTEEREIQKAVAGIQAVTSVVFSCITVFVVFFTGPWSDTHGRKIPLVISTMGLMLMPTMMIVGYLCLGKISAVYISLLAMLPTTLSGGATVYSMSAGSYICDTTTPKNRTVRMGVFWASVRSSTPIGFMLGGLLMKCQVGMVKSLLIPVGLSGLAFLIVFLKVRNGKPEAVFIDSGENGGTAKYSGENDEVEKFSGERDTIEKFSGKNDRTAKYSGDKPCWRKYNPVTNLIQVFGMLFQKREHALWFYLLILAHICYASPGAEQSLVYLFVRERLQWNISNFGFFSMINWVLSAGGVFLSMFVLSKTLKLSDPLVGFVSGISQISGSTMYAFTTTRIMMFCASVLDMMNGTIGVVVKSMLSKSVAINEVGKLFALLGAIDSLLPLVTMPTYAFVYRSTVTFFSGAFFLLSAGITLPVEIIFMESDVDNVRRR
ncbi:uncharacterized protein LOC118433628 isoform X2 [Folsomia candida]|uniref:uncharacterized protein LOC110862876 isoform X2 n=1 Tax=Folsomia candida TaxID=158441 RepID=UPI00160526ED|nr:uncharacterized protein LOC110862876 isoform X2 [Folsomia candida]XP_035701670.1 uncharacterized protein LOC118433628 isoform X2 [Folsomia candida]